MHLFPDFDEPIRIKFFIEFLDYFGLFSNPKIGEGAIYHCRYSRRNLRTENRLKRTEKSTELHIVDNF